MTSGAEMLRQRRAAENAAKAAEAARQAEIARVAREAETARIAKEQEEKAKEAETARVAAANAEAARIAKEAETARQAEADKKAKEAEAARVVAANAEAVRIAKEAEAARIAKEQSEKATKQQETAPVVNNIVSAHNAENAQPTNQVNMDRPTTGVATSTPTASTTAVDSTSPAKEQSEKATKQQETAPVVNNIVPAPNAENAQPTNQASMDRPTTGVATSTPTASAATAGSANLPTLNKSDNNILAQDDRYSLVDKKTLDVKYSIDTQDMWKKLGYTYGVLDNDVYSDRNSKEKLKVAEDNLTAKLVDDVRNGRLDFNRDDGTFKYTPKTGFSGEDRFTYQVCKSSLCSNIATVTITMKNYAPKVKDDAYTIREDNVLNANSAEGVFAKTGLIIYGVLNNDKDKNKNKLSAELVSDVKHGKLEFNKDGTFKYTPNKGYFGPDDFGYKVWDGIEYSSPAKARITVERNNPPQAVNDQYKMKQGNILNADRVKDNTGFGHKIATYGVLSNDMDSNKDPLTASVVKKPDHGELSFNNDGTFKYIPVSNYFGDDYFTYIANDGTLNSNLATAYIIIQSSNTEL